MRFQKNRMAYIAPQSYSILLEVECSSMSGVDYDPGYFSASFEFGESGVDESDDYYLE